MLLNKQGASVGGHCQWNMRSKACIHIEKTKTIVPLWFVNQHVSVLAIPKVMNDISKSIFGKSISTFSCTSCIWMKMPFFYFARSLVYFFTVSHFSFPYLIIEGQYLFVWKWFFLMINFMITFLLLNLVIVVLINPHQDTWLSC